MTFVDVNVLLEVILQRVNATACEQFLANDETKAISTLSLDLVMYFVEREKLDWRPVKGFLESFNWLPITDSDAQWAFANFAGNDFEDALQVSCALRENCIKFVTLDNALAKKYAQILPVKLLR